MTIKTTQLVVLATVIAAASGMGCTKKEGEQTAASGNATTTTNPAGTQQNAAPAASDLKIENIKVGAGTEAVAGKQVTVHYTGTLTDGKKFDSSVDRGQPFKFQLGAGQVIQGWDKGVAGMKIGGKRKLTIPPALGYGARGAGNVIPPDATLLFEVELLRVD